jgi:MATE family multidrug resistance protein
MERRIFEEHQKGTCAEVWHIAYPAVLTMFSQTAMSFTDAVMVGKLGVSQLAAVGLAGTLVWGLYSFFNGLVNGVNTFVAQDYGAKRYDRIGRMTWQGVYFSALSGVILFLLSYRSTGLFRLMGPEPDVQAVGLVYLRIMLRGGVFTILWMCFSAFLRGLGDTRTPLKITLLANVFNVVGDYVLIFGKFGFPRLETEGAAIATVSANAMGTMLFLLVFLRHKRAHLYSTRSGWRPAAGDMGRLARIGLPIGTQWFLDMGSFIFFSAMIGRIGTAQLAASVASLRLLMTSFLPLVGVGIAATTLVGQYIGSGEPELACKSGNSALRLGLYYTTGIAMAFLVFAGKLVALINSDPEVIRIGARIIRLAALFQVFDGVGIISGGCLRGAGDTRWTMLIGTIFAWGLFLPLAYLGGFILDGGAFGAWAGATAYIIALGVVFYFRFRSGKWQSIKI